MKSRRRYHVYMGIVLVLFVMSLAFFTGLGNFGGGRAPYLSARPTPPGTGWYIDLQWGLTETHYYVLYHGIGPSIENLRQADIVLLGDSRALLGFDWRLVDEFARAHGLRIFNLAVDGGTGWEFPLNLMLRHGIRPRAVVLTVPAFVVNPVFKAAREAMDSGFLASFKYVVSGETLWRIKSLAAMVSESLFTRIFPRQSLNATYRSTQNGCWFRDDWLDNAHGPVRPAAEPCLQDYDAPEPLCKALSEWGAGVVVSDIPRSDWCPGQAEQLANKMRAQSITVSPEGLCTYDGSHLDRASSALYTKRFLEALATTETFRQMSQGL